MTSPMTEAKLEELERHRFAWQGTAAGQALGEALDELRRLRKGLAEIAWETTVAVIPGENHAFALERIRAIAKELLNA